MITRDGTEAVLKLEVTSNYSLCGMPLFATRSERVLGLPEPVPGTLFLVTAEVRAFCCDRKDIASHTGNGTLHFNP